MGGNAVRGSRNRRCLQLLLVMAIVCLTAIAGIARFGLVRSSSRGIDLVATARNIISMEPDEVKLLRSREVDDHEEGRLEYYFHQLSEKEQRAYREMLTSLRSWEPEFYLTVGQDDEIDRVFHAVLNDHPELFWARNRNTVYKTVYTGQEYSRFTPSYLYGTGDPVVPGPGPLAEQIQADIDTACRQIDAMIPSDADAYQKAETVYSWLIGQTEYAETENDQSVAGVFHDRIAVCAGYAAAFQLLAEHVGLECIYVEGSSLTGGEGHAWNIVSIDGTWYYVDVTNGDQPEFLTGDFASLSEHHTILMDYLCPFPAEYERMYRASDMFSVPACTSTEKNFYVMNGSCFDYYDQGELNSYFHMRIDNGAAVIRFKYSGEEPFLSASYDWPGSAGMEDAVQYYMAKNGLSQVQFHYGSLDGLYTMYYIF